MRCSLLLICLIILLAQIFWYLSVIVPKSSFYIPVPVRLVLNGQTPVREVYQKKELLQEVYKALGNETPIGIQFETLFRRFYPKQKYPLNKDYSVAPAYYTLNDWAFGMLEFIPFKDLPNHDDTWRNEVSKLLYQSSYRPIFGLENASYENNRELVLKWKSLLQKYLY